MVSIIIVLLLAAAGFTGLATFLAGVMFVSAVLKFLGPFIVLMFVAWLISNNK